MEIREAIQEILKDMPDERVREVLDFAHFLASRERDAWQAFGREQLSRGYGDDEPEY